MCGRLLEQPRNGIHYSVHEPWAEEAVAGYKIRAGKRLTHNHTERTWNQAEGSPGKAFLSLIPRHHLLSRDTWESGANGKVRPTLWPLPGENKRPWGEILLFWPTPVPAWKVDLLVASLWLASSLGLRSLWCGAKYHLQVSLLYPLQNHRAGGLAGAGLGQAR